MRIILPADAHVVTLAVGAMAALAMQIVPYLQWERRTQQCLSCLEGGGTASISWTWLPPSYECTVQERRGEPVTLTLP